MYSFPQLMNGCTMVGLNCNCNIFRNGLPHLYRMLFYYHGQSTKAGTGIQAIYVVSGAFESGKFSSTAFPSAPLPSTPTHPTAPSPCPNSYRCPRPHHYVSRPLYCADIEYVWGVSVWYARALVACVFIFFAQAAESSSWSMKMTLTLRRRALQQCGASTFTRCKRESTQTRAPRSTKQTLT